MLYNIDVAKIKTKMWQKKARAINNTREFLYKLIDPKQTPKVPKNVRSLARSCLRHFPAEYEIEMAQEKTPELWGEAKKRP